MKKLSLLLCLLLSLQISNAKEYLCYVPGGAGLSEYMKNEIGNELKNRNIPFVAFDAGPWGTVEERSQNVLRDFEKLLQEDADAECHLFGYSMGGLVSRYSANHLNFRARNGQRMAFKNRVRSMTSFSSPHKGTPAADILNDFPEILRPGLEQLSLKNIERFNDSASASYSPVIDGIPFYSYRNFVGEDEEIPDLAQRLGYTFITTYYMMRLQFKKAMNDGLVPTFSMEFGKVLDARNLYNYGLPQSQQIVEDHTPREKFEKSGDFRYSHEFYSQDLGMDIDAADVFEAHYKLVIQN